MRPFYSEDTPNSRDLGAVKALALDAEAVRDRNMTQLFAGFRSRTDFFCLEKMAGTEFVFSTVLAPVCRIISELGRRNALPTSLAEVITEVITLTSTLPHISWPLCVRQMEPW